MRQKRAGQWQSGEAGEVQAGTAGWTPAEDLIASVIVILHAGKWQPPCMWRNYHDLGSLHDYAFITAKMCCRDQRSKFQLDCVVMLRATTRCGTSCIRLSHADIFQRGLWVIAILLWSILLKQTLSCGSDSAVFAFSSALPNFLNKGAITRSEKTCLACLFKS